jgi:hypothetical protein
LGELILEMPLGLEKKARCNSVEALGVVLEDLEVPATSMYGHHCRQQDIDHVYPYAGVKLVWSSKEEEILPL